MSKYYKASQQIKYVLFSYLDKNTSGQPGSPNVNLEFLDSSEFVARTWQHRESQALLQSSSCFPFSSHSLLRPSSHQQGSLVYSYGLPSPCTQFPSLPSTPLLKLLKPVVYILGLGSPLEGLTDLEKACSEPKSQLGGVWAENSGVPICYSENKDCQTVILATRL